MYVITGGAGFIGSNLVAALLDQGHEVRIIDNLTRPGVRSNLAWLQSHKDSNKLLDVAIADIRDYNLVLAAIKDAHCVIHLAGQVAVTTSVKDPLSDFEINALGTLNVLEAARAQSTPPGVIFSSTNKVYGGLERYQVTANETRYLCPEIPEGVSESENLDFHSPYGCSKGAADQYTRDYFRIYGVPTVVLRQSCIYGPRQFGLEDQGWLAWFIIALLLNKKVTICGDGKQVRDLLYVDDLVNLIIKISHDISRYQGQVFNVGGGANQTLSIWTELKPLLEELVEREITVTFADWRPGDQRIYTSNIAKITELSGWKPTVSVKEGVKRLYHWTSQNLQLIEGVLSE